MEIILLGGEGWSLGGTESKKLYFFLLFVLMHHSSSTWRKVSSSLKVFLMFKIFPPFLHTKFSRLYYKMMTKSIKGTFEFTSVKDHVCECTRRGLGLLNTSRTYLPQVGGAKLSISSTSPVLAVDGFTDGGEEPSWRNRPPPVSRHSCDLLWGSWKENGHKQSWAKKTDCWIRGSQ